VSIHSLGLFRERTHVQFQCRHIYFSVTWMMDLGKCSLDGHDLGKKDSFLGGLHGSYTLGITGM
jgi:hypothetical protein